MKIGFIKRSEGRQKAETALTTLRIFLLYNGIVFFCVCSQWFAVLTHSLQNAAENLTL